MTIPRIAFSFWEGNQFTYMHYLTIYTFTKHNPDIKVVIYRTLDDNQPLIMWDSFEQKRILHNFYDINKLKDIPNVEFKYVDFAKELHYYNPISSVWKSDIIRIIKLYEHGGFYIDFDTLFIKKIDESLFHIPHDVAFNTYEGVINNAFMVARPKSDIIGTILHHILQRLYSQPMSKNYEQFGPALITELILRTNLKNKVTFIQNEMTCPYLWNEMNTLFHSTRKQHTNKTFCIHWYNGGDVSRKYCSEFDIEKIDATRNNFESLLVQSLQ